MAITVDFETALERLYTGISDACDLKELISTLGSNDPGFFNNKFAGGLEIQQIPDELAGFSIYYVESYPAR